MARSVHTATLMFTGSVRVQASARISASSPITRRVSRGMCDTTISAPRHASSASSSLPTNSRNSASLMFGSIGYPSVVSLTLIAPAMGSR